jgi:hypothetical protein
VKALTDENIKSWKLGRFQLLETLHGLITAISGGHLLVEKITYSII